MPQPAMDAGPERAAALGVAAHESATPGSQVPGSQVPGSQVPGTQVPGTQVPGTQVPGTQAYPRRLRSRRRGRGRPRRDEADQAILVAAARRLAEHGLAGMSLDDVASDASVSKSSIYRRWPSKAMLAMDAFLSEFRVLSTPPDTGTLRGDIAAALGAWVTAATTTNLGNLLVGLIAQAQSDAEFAAVWRARVIQPTRVQYAIIFDRAASRGELAGHAAADVALDMVFGAGLYRLLHGHRPLTAEFVSQVADIIATGLERVP